MVSKTRLAISRRRDEHQARPERRYVYSALEPDIVQKHHGPSPRRVARKRPIEAASDA
jgi:hypothetical protein